MLHLKVPAMHFFAWRHWRMILARKARNAARAGSHARVFANADPGGIVHNAARCIHRLGCILILLLAEGLFQGDGVHENFELLENLWDMATDVGPDFGIGDQLGKIAPDDDEVQKL